MDAGHGGGGRVPGEYASTLGGANGGALFCVEYCETY